MNYDNDYAYLKHIYSSFEAHKINIKQKCSHQYKKNNPFYFTINLAVEFNIINYNFKYQLTFYYSEIHSVFYRVYFVDENV